MELGGRVSLKKPDIDMLNREGFTPVDMHFHTRFSDTYTSVSRAVALGEKKGVGIAITDHNTIEGAKLAYRLKDSIMIIPGIETSSKEGPHILSYFPNLKSLKAFYEACVMDRLSAAPYLRTGASVREIIRGTRDFGGITAAAHPFCPGMMGLHKAVKREFVPKSAIADIDAFEVVTGVNMKSMTAKSIRLAEKLKKPITGGSDGHSLFELGKVVTYSKASTPKRFLRNIIEHESRVMGKETGFSQRVPSYTKTTRKHLKYIRPFLMQRAQSVIRESVYYHTSHLNTSFRKLRERGIEMVIRKANGFHSHIFQNGDKGKKQARGRR